MDNLMRHAQHYVQFVQARGRKRLLMHPQSNLRCDSDRLRYYVLSFIVGDTPRPVDRVPAKALATLEARATARGYSIINVEE